MGGTPLERLSVTGTPVLLHGRAGTISGGSVYNTGGVSGYVQLFDATAAADVTLGTTSAYKTIPASPMDNDDIEAGEGIYFSKGIVAAGTTTPTGSTGLAHHLFFILR